MARRNFIQKYMLFIVLGATFGHTIFCAKKVQITPPIEKMLVLASSIGPVAGVGTSKDQTVPMPRQYNPDLFPDQWLERFSPKHPTTQPDQNADLGKALGALTVSILSNKLKPVKKYKQTDSSPILNSFVAKNRHAIYREPSTKPEDIKPFATHSMVFITGIGLPEKQTHSLLLDAFETYLPKTILVVPTQIINRFILAGHKIPHADKWSCRTKGSLQVFVPNALLNNNKDIELDWALGVYWSRFKPVKNFWEQPQKQEILADKQLEEIVFSDFANLEVSNELFIPFFNLESRPNKNSKLENWVLYIVGGGTLGQGQFFDRKIGRLTLGIKLELCFWEVANLDVLEKKLYCFFPLGVKGFIASKPEQIFDFKQTFSLLTENGIHKCVEDKNFIPLGTITRNRYSPFFVAKNRHTIYREPSTKPEDIKPFATHSMVFVTGIGLPENQTHRLLLDAFETCLPKTVLVVPTQVLDRFLLTGHKIPHTDKWACRTKGSLRVFVPNALLTNNTNKNNNKDVEDWDLGLYWSKFKPVKNFWEPQKQEILADKQLEEIVFSDFANLKDISNQLFIPFFNLESRPNKNCKPAKWVLYIAGGGTLCQGQFFDMKIGRLTLGIKLELCFWETIEDLDVLKKGLNSSFPLIISGLIASGLEQKIDFKKLFSPLTESGFHKCVEGKSFIALDTITRNLYSSFKEWDNPGYNGVVPRVRLRTKEDPTPYINLEQPLVNTTKPNSILVKQDTIVAKKPFATHGMVIFNCAKDYKGCTLDSFEAAMRMSPDSNAIIIVPSGLVSQYIEEHGKLPNADAWLCRYIDKVEVYVPKTALTLAYGYNVNSKKEIQEIDARLGIKWSSLNPIKDFETTEKNLWKNYFWATHSDGGPDDMSKIMREQVLVTLSEYELYNKSHKYIGPAQFAVTFNGHGNSGTTVDMAIEEAMNNGCTPEKLNLLKLCRKKGLIFMPGKIGLVANFETGLIDLLKFFNRECSVKLIFIDTCFGWSKKFEELDTEGLNYVLITNNLVNTTSSSLGKNTCYGKFFKTLQKRCSINLKELIKDIYQIYPNEGMWPEIRLPGEKKFSPVTASGEIGNEAVVISKKREADTLEISIANHALCPVLLDLADIPYTIKFSQDATLGIGTFISIIPGSAIHTITEIDAPEFTLQEIIRAFSRFKLKENKVFVVNKIRARGTIKDLSSTQISQVKLTVVNSSGTDEYDDPIVRILVENLDNTSSGPLGGYAEWKTYIKNNLILNPCNTKEELEKQVIDIKKIVNTIKWIRDFV